MVFPETVLFDFILLHLEEEMASYAAPPAEPLPCDRWIARSCLQKAIRRGEVKVAQRALATLLEHDRYGVWRHLIVIALEDVGVAEIDTVAWVVAVGRNRSWRKAHGGEWVVASFLVQVMAEGRHCQAACDLLLRALNCPLFEETRRIAYDADSSDLSRRLLNTDAALEERGIAALALGGGLMEEQRHRDAAMVFGLLASQGHSSHVIATCAAAWAASRNPMAVLLPLIWQRWVAGGSHEVRSDITSPAELIGCVPAYAVDQFTRIGGQVARTYLSRDLQMQMLMDSASIPGAQRPRAVGDLVFLNEGSCLVRRIIWAVGDELRLPSRSLSNAIQLGGHLQPALRHLEATRSVIADLRRQYLLPHLPG